MLFLEKFTAFELIVMVAIDEKIRYNFKQVVIRFVEILFAKEWIRSLDSPCIFLKTMI